MATNNFLNQYINALKNSTEEQIIATASEAIKIFIRNTFSREEMQDQETAETIYFIMIICAKIGVSSKNGTINDKEKNMIDKVFPIIDKGDYSETYGYIKEKVKEKDYDALRTMDEAPYGFELLKFIFAFGYIDGVMDEYVENKVESYFGSTLLKIAFRMNSDNATEKNIVKKELFGSYLNTDGKEADIPMTDDERKVYDCVARLDDGSGNTADLYYDLYGSWKLQGMFDDMKNFDGELAISMLNNNSNELNMSKYTFVKNLDSLVKKEYLIKKDQFYLINPYVKPKKSSVSVSNQERIRDKEEADRNSIKLASDIRKKMNIIYSEYENDSEKNKEMIEMNDFESLEDPKLLYYLNNFNTIIQTMGAKMENMIVDAITSYNKIANDASPRNAIAVIEAIEEAINTVEETSIVNEDLDLDFSYNWEHDFEKIKQQLSKEKRGLKNI